MISIMFVTMPGEGEVRNSFVPRFYKRGEVRYIPIGVLSVASSVRSISRVSILDASSKGLSVSETIKAINDANPDVVALSVVTQRAWAMSEILRGVNARIKVVGGPHATFNSDLILKQGADAVFVGPSEFTFRNWIEENCPSGVFRSDPVDLDSVPMIDWSLVDLREYGNENRDSLLFDAGNLRLTMYTSQGCPRKCIYCDVQEKKYRFKSPARCIDEFMIIVSLGASSIHIIDDAFNVDRERAIKICDGIARTGTKIDWSARVTVETNEHVIASIASAGCKRLHVGIESLDDSVLKYLRKSQRLKGIEQFCRLCSKYNIDIYAYFIIGSPVETEDYRRRLPSMIKDMGIKFPQFNVLTPLPKTDYYNSLLSDKVVPVDYWQDFCENPSRDWCFPSFLPQDEEIRIQEMINEYVDLFFRH